MAKFLLTCYPIAGHLHPNIALAEALRSRGHQVAVYSGSKAKETLTAVGLQHFSYHPEMDAKINSILMPAAPQKFTTADISRTHFPLVQFKRINRHLINWFVDTIPQQVEDLKLIINQWTPDAVVSDIALFGPILFLSEITSSPTAVFCVLPACSVPGPDAPAWGRGLPPPRTLATRLRSSVENSVKTLFLAGFRNELNKLRSRYGLAPIKIPAMAYAGQLPLYMVVGTPEFDYNRTDLPKSVHYVGPCLWHRPNSEPPPLWLSEISRKQPVIYVTEGTVHVRKPFLLQAAVAALSDENLQLIMTTGKHRDPADIGLSANSKHIRIEKYISHGDLFPLVDIVVTTGGTGTILSALLMGIPLIIVPTGWDLPENAQRVVEAGVGVRIEPQHCTAKNIRSAVYQVLDDPQYRRNAKRIGAALAQRGGPDRAVELLEQLLDNRLDDEPSDVYP